MESYYCEIEWDKNKDKINREKHGVAFHEAKAVFRQSSPKLTKDDYLHLQHEQRYETTGRSKRGKVLTVIHTCGGNRIRIISAWKSSISERQDYYAHCGQYL